MKTFFDSATRLRILVPAGLLGLALLCPSARAATLIDVWRAEDLNLNNGDAIGTWTSASNRTVNASVGLQPTLQRNATPAGGAAVRFNTSFMTAGSSPVGGATAFSVVVVFKATAAGAAADGSPWYQCTGLVDAEQGGVVNDWGMVFNGSGHVAGGSGNPDITTPSTGASLVDGNFHVAVFTWGGSSQSVHVDTRPVVTQATTATAARNNGGFAIGGILTGEGGAARRFIGDMAEVRFYNSALSTVEASNVISELTDTHTLGNLPRIHSFTASTNQIYLGQPVTLAWAASGAMNVSIDQGIGSVSATNNTVIFPSSTATYTLTATNTNGVRTASVVVTVDPGVPTAFSFATNTAFNTPVAITLRGSDPQGSNLTFAIVAPPAHGSLSGTPPNVTYTPSNNFGGLDSFTLKANDGLFDSANATVSLNVIPPALSPTGITLSSTNIPTEAGPGAFVASLQAVDINNLYGDTHTFALVAGGPDNAQFTVSGNLLYASPSFAGGPGATFSIRLSTTDSTSFSFTQDVSLAVVDVPRTVVINELHYNNPENTIFEGFIELHNPGASQVDISQWRIRGGVDFTFPANTFIDAGGFVVVAENVATLFNRFGVSAFGPWEGGVNNDGEEITLRNALNTVVDRVDFKSEFPWPISPNGGGASMQLVNAALDNDLGSSWRGGTPTPGAINSVWSTNAAPNIRQVNHAPKTPASTNLITITAKVTDPEGVASVSLAYQVVAPGNYIPSYIAPTVAELNADPARVPLPNPAYEAPANWTTVGMHDDGLNGDLVAGDTIYTVVLPQQANRTLVRYRITCADSLGVSRRAPFEDDPSLNFACFVYDGIPAYENVSAAVLESLPVYFLLSRAADVDVCLAYNGANQIAQFSGPVANEARFVFNWPGAIVYDGEVYDHIRYRLRGANGRYQNGKRNWRIKFNDGKNFAAKDQNGKAYPRKWQSLNTGKGSSNRETLTYGLNEVLNLFLWNKVSVPAPNTHFFHFRVVDGAQEAPDRYSGDFWGLNWAQENYDSAFLEAHDMPKGNLYKLINAPRSTDAFLDMQKQRRYQAPFAVTNGADAVNIQNNVGANKTTSWLLAHINYTNFYRYHVVCEAARNYDFWPSANKNAAWYFEPIYGASNSYLGRMMTLPWDNDSSWGPSWNGGQDVAHNGIFNDSGVTGGTAGENLELQIDYRNTARELRHLLFQPDQIYPVIDAFAAGIRDFVPADLARWSNSPVNGSYVSLAMSGPALSAGLAGYVQDLKNFMFVGGNNPWWIDRQSIGAGGWSTRLDTLATDAAIPTRPTITYVGSNGYPASGLTFQSSAFADPQGAGTFGAMQWRIAQVLPTNTVVSNPSQLKLEWDASWLSPELPAFGSTMTFPEFAVTPGATYRARVRHKDNTGRWSEWSPPAVFAPSASPIDNVAAIRTNLVFNEIMYNPPPYGFIDGDELEYFELKNIGALPLDLSGLFFSAGIDFTFTNGTVLAPGALLVLVRNSLTFNFLYPSSQIDGLYTGKLNNDGETLTIRHPVAGDLVSITYGDRAPWPVTANGHGFSIVRDAAGVYRASATVNGNPGEDGGATAIGGVIINELLSSSTLPLRDYIELLNTASTNVDISGWFLTDDAKLPQKFRIPNRAPLAPGEFVVFTEDDFNPTPGLGTSFSFSSLGDEAYLFSANAGSQLTGFDTGFAFGAAADGESFGRYINSVGELQYPAQWLRTPGATNFGPRIGPVTITEIMYHPEAGGDEFVELKNITGAAVALFDPLIPTNTWKLSGLGFTFPTNLTLGSNEWLLIVATNPAAFRAKYGVPAEVQIAGPFTGNLQDSGERLQLQQPGVPGTNGVPYITIDEVRYNDKTPWPAVADGAGPSLQRRSFNLYGNDPTNWLAAIATPGDLRGFGLAPGIATSPSNQLAVLGGTVSFTVVATGDAPLNYRWQARGTNLPGATNATLTLNNVQLGDATNYTAVIFNQAGAVFSAGASLTVLSPVMFTIQPTNQDVLPGTNVALVAQAVGNGTVTYQWRFNGTNILNATNASYSFTGANLTNHHGVFSCFVQDDISTATSAGAFIYVLVRPGFVQGLAPFSVLQGGTFTLSVTVTGAPPIWYRWLRAGAAFATTSIPTITITNYQVTTLPTSQFRVGATNTAAPGGVFSPNAGNIIISMIPDFDGDGIADSWEAAYFGSGATNNAGNAALDDDGDGMSNLDEYRAGTNPTNALSLLNVIFTQTNAGVLSFVAQTNLTYSVQWRTNLAGPGWTNLTSILASPQVRTVTVDSASAPPGGERYFRIVTPMVP